MDKSEKRFRTIRSIGEECISDDELQALIVRTLESGTEMLAYDGFEPSGKIHICQGLMRAVNTNKLVSNGCRFIFWIADYFAKLNHKFGGDLEKIQNAGKLMIETWRACRMDMSKVDFRWCSDEIRADPDYWDGVMQLSTVVSIGRAKKCTQALGRDENDNQSVSSLLYAVMQAVDISYLNVDICSLGMDQRKVNMLYREFATQDRPKPVILSHHMVLGLDGTKMSKSNPNQAIFMDDDVNTVKRKIKKAFCQEGNITVNPLLEYIRYIIFPITKEFKLERKEKFGGNKLYTLYTDLENDFRDKLVFPLDLKNNVTHYVNELLEPIRKHFRENEWAKNLKLLVESYYT